MRRREIVDGVLQLVAALQESQLQQLLEALLHARAESSKGPIDSPAIAAVDALRAYTLAFSRFNVAAKTVELALELDELRSTAVWTKLLLPGRSPDLGTIALLHSTVRFATHNLPRLLKLISQEEIATFSEAAPEGRDGLQVLTVILPESKDSYSKPERLSDTLIAIKDLYEACSEILVGESANDLSVVGCDSGSDKAFDFLGAAKTIGGLKELLLELWDRVVFYREKKLHRRLELVAEALPIVEKIGQLEDDKKIGPEQAELVRRKVLGGASKFLSCGAIIPEMKDRIVDDPRALMAPEPKLLTSGPAVDVDDAPDALTPEERAMLEKLRRKERRTDPQ